MSNQLGQLDPQEFRDLLAVLEARVLPELKTRLEPLVLKAQQELEQKIGEELKLLAQRAMSSLQAELARQILKVVHDLPAQIDRAVFKAQIGRE